MKFVLLLLLIPFFTAAQTVHVDDGRIVYKETVKVKGIPKETLYQRANKSLRDNVRGNSVEINTDKKDSGIIETQGKITLNSPFHIKRTVHYTVTLKIDDGEYKYQIDSVYIKQKERGGKSKVIASEDLLKDMDVTGILAIETEKQLNEIDMRFQKFLYMLKSDMKKTEKVKNTKNNIKT